MNNTLTNYGYEFETKFLASLIDDENFLIQISDVLQPAYFQNLSAQWIIENILDYYRKFNSGPSLVFFKTEIAKLPDTKKLLKEESVSYLRDAQRYKDSKDLEYVKQEAVNFCRNQAMKKAILESVDLLNDNDFEGIKSKLDDALKVGQSREIGHIYIDDFEDRYTASQRIVCPTPWDPLNNVMQGGLSGGELGVVIAPSGVGKSWVLSALGAHAVSLGKTVFHYTLELNKIYTALRYDSILSGVDNSNLIENKHKVKDIVDRLKGKLIIESYPNKTASVLTLKSHIDRCKSIDMVPDVIIVDYADLLKGHNKELRFELRQIYEGLRGLSAELDIPLWTASQSNRSSISEEIITADKISEDYSKISTSDFVISLSSQSNFYVIKNRLGPSNILFPSKFDPSNGNIIMSPSGSSSTKDFIHSKSDSLNEDQKKELYNMFLSS